MDTSAASAGSNGIAAGSIIGSGTSSGAGIIVHVVFGFLCVLFAMSLARSVITLMMTYHSAGLYNPPNVSRK